MKMFDELSIQKLTQISNALSIIGVILVLAGIFTLPLGLIYIAMAAALFYFDSLVNKAKNKKAQEEFELRRSLNRTEWENRSHMVMPENNDSINETSILRGPNSQKSELSDFHKKDSPYYGSDLIESSDTPFVCSECAKYTKRWFSEYGQNPKYPKLPSYFKEHLQEHQDCAIRFSPVLDKISQPAWDYKGNFVEFCNRPFVDERTPEQKRIFEEAIADKERKATTREEYDWICSHLSAIAPKSLGGYTRMKNINSEKYQEIKALAAEQGKKLI